MSRHGAVESETVGCDKDARPNGGEQVMSAILHREERHECPHEPKEDCRDREERWDDLMLEHQRKMNPLDR